MNQVVPLTRHICCEQVWEPGDWNGGDSSYGHIPIKEHMGIQHRSDVWNSIICGSQPWNPVIHWYLPEGCRENQLPNSSTCPLSGLRTLQCCSKPSIYSVASAQDIVDFDISEQCITPSLMLQLISRWCRHQDREEFAMGSGSWVMTTTSSKVFVLCSCGLRII
jgi:hypothetical protein